MIENTIKLPRTTIGGEDEAHELSVEEKDHLELGLRESARKDRRDGRSKDAARKNNRAINISRKPSKRAQHHK